MVNCVHPPGEEVSNKGEGRPGREKAAGDILPVAAMGANVEAGRKKLQRPVDLCIVDCSLKGFTGPKFMACVGKCAVEGSRMV
jgi:hypothetical protein